MPVESWPLRIETPDDYESWKVIAFNQMQTEQIVSLLIAERDRLSRAIAALQEGVSRRGQSQTPSAASKPASSAPVNGAPKKRRISAAGRKAIAEATKRRWAAIKAKKADVTATEGNAAPSVDEQFKNRMSEAMKASWAKRKKAAAKKKAA